MERAHPDPIWTEKHKRAFGRAWSKLRASVEDALSQPDDVQSTRGFIYEIAGGWWERLRSVGCEDTMASWMSFNPSADFTSLTIEGKGFGEGGLEAASWQAFLVSVRAKEAKLEYYWEGRRPGKSQLLFGGAGSFQFTVQANGRITDGTGEFKDVCMDVMHQAEPSTTRMVDILKASKGENLIMDSSDENVRRALANQKLLDWDNTAPDPTR